MVTPSVAASTSPIRSNTASRSPATVKPVLSGADVADAPTEERLTDCVASPPGSFIAPEVSGRFRSGGTSSGQVDPGGADGARDGRVGREFLPVTEPCVLFDGLWGDGTLHQVGLRRRAN